jgi:hypothetical protein
MATASTGYCTRMEFTTVGEEEFGAPVQDVAQEAIDATATRYARTPGIDVTQTLREQLHGRGLAAVSEADLERLAEGIRSGHAPRVGEHDGSIG